MNFVGKILIVMQLVLALFIMVFAAVVYTAHMNWRTAAENLKKEVAKARDEASSANSNLAAKEREFAEKLAEARQRADQLDATRKGLDQELATLKKNYTDLQVGQKTASEQALIANQDAAARKVEADNERAINHELTMKRDDELKQRIKLEDANRGLEIALEVAGQKNRNLLEQVALYQQTLAASGIPTDIGELTAKTVPPPGVDGEIREVRRGRRQGETELVEVSLGSDDGLKRGHLMTVYRSGGSQNARYLAQIKIVDTTPDRSVGQVIESSRNGTIQKGDHVTTKL